MTETAIMDVLWVLAFPLTALTVALTFIVDTERLTPLYVITVLVLLLTVFIGIQQNVN